MGAKTAARFSQGQLVRFKANDQLVDAKVITIDSDTGVLPLERIDNKNMVRQPAGWVYAAG